MIIANGEKIEHLVEIMDGEQVGTLFCSNPVEYFQLLDYVKHSEQ